MKSFIIGFATVVMTVFCFAETGKAAEEDLPFRPGEKLTFDLKWTIIKAGEATLEVLPVETVNGVPSYHFVMTAKSTPFLDVFYKVRDRIDAYTDTKMTRTLFYKKKQKEGRTHRDIVVRFDWKKKEAYYSNFGEKRDPLSLLPGAFDPLSAFFYCRFLDMKENTVIERPITDGKKCVIGRVKVVRREKIKLGDKVYDTWLLEPELKHVGGVFEKSRDAKIQLWVSADKRRIPVKIKSKVIVGSFSAELVSMEVSE
ncbi:MAG TPA: DUF3108 domain-containing protein [Desulfobacterales bacterium]|nr:DUF3108 domain-containing protein [Desulfobacterales bacterium]